MKNNSLQNPFPTLNDSFFDKDRDRRLNTIETAFRDAHLNELKQKANQIEAENKSDSVHNITKSSQNDVLANILAVCSVVIALIVILIKIIIS